ncbi:MAG: glutathione S-transferase N-terminal domain-containing protein [Myxococcota bacterium]
MATNPETPIVIVGRSSSHFTRVARIFAAELDVAYALRVVPDLTSLDASVYAGNPALKIPVLQAPSGTWYGALSICRELARLSERSVSIVWPEALSSALPANAQELVLHAMTSEVALIMSGQAPAGAGAAKLRASLGNSLAWLDANCEAVLAALPPRDLSYLEVTLYCLVTHLPFRQIHDVAQYTNLVRFRERFGVRESAQQTSFRFDAA